MTNPEDYYKQIMDTANLGKDCTEFMGSKLGEYINAKAEKLELITLRKLAKTDPEDKLAIRALQLEAAGPRLMLSFIAEAIKEGEVAQYQLNQEYEQE